METSLMSFGRKAAIAAVAFATVGSTLFGGAALAGDDWNGHGKGGHGNGGHPGKDDKKAAKVIKGGDAKSGDATCVQKEGFIDLDVSHVLAGLLGTATLDRSCTAVSGPAVGGDAELNH
jgi:hypothetical protein